MDNDPKMEISRNHDGKAIFYGKFWKYFSQQNDLEVHCNWSFGKSMCWFAVSMFVLREGNDKERDGIQRVFWRSGKMFKKSTLSILGPWI